MWQAERRKCWHAAACAREYRGSVAGHASAKFDRHASTERDGGEAGLSAERTRTVLDDTLTPSRQRSLAAPLERGGVAAYAFGKYQGVPNAEWLVSACAICR